MAHTSYNQVVLLGDSLFEKGILLEDEGGYSFQAALQSHCKRRLDVINRGMSGWNTRHVLEYLPKLIPKYSEGSPKIDYLVILLGANDAALEDHPSNTQGITLAEYKKNLVEIVDHAHVKAHDPRILLVTPPPLDEKRMAHTDLRDSVNQGKVTRLAGHSAKFSQAVRELTKREEWAGRDIRLLNLFDAISQAARERAGIPAESETPRLGYPEDESDAFGPFLPDGLHMSSVAYKLLVNLIVTNMAPFPDAPEGYVYNGWRDMVPKTKEEQHINNIKNDPTKQVGGQE